MKIKPIVLLFIFAISFFLVSCNTDDDVNQNSFNVTVLRQGNKCGIVDNDNSTVDYLIEFNQVTTNLPLSNHYVYYAANLPQNFKVDGLQITIEYRDLNDDDAVICDAAIGGDDYPFVYILNVN